MSRVNWSDMLGNLPDDLNLALNNRRGDAQLTSTTVAQPVTEPVFNASSRVLNKPIFGQPNEGNQPRTGDLRGASGVRVLPPGFDVLLEADNQSDNPVYFYAQFKQFEVKASTMPDPTEI